MNWRFFWARFQNDESGLRAGTLSQEALYESVAGKRVAIVGNARALSQTQCGQLIDGCDIVIRLNAAPMPSAISHGRSTDWLAVSIPVEAEVVKTRQPNLLLWMTPKRKRLPFGFVQRGLGFYLHPKRSHANLTQELCARPTTGAMVISLISKSPAASIEVFGFDFFSSLSLSGRRTAKDVPHDFAAEARYVTELVEADARVTLHAME